MVITVPIGVINVGITIVLPLRRLANPTLTDPGRKLEARDYIALSSGEQPLV